LLFVLELNGFQLIEARSYFAYIQRLDVFLEAFITAVVASAVSIARAPSICPAVRVAHAVSHKTLDSITDFSNMPLVDVACVHCADAVHHSVDAIPQVSKDLNTIHYGYVMGTSNNVGRSYATTNLPGCKFRCHGRA
jgi:hypothetical protein